MTAEARALAESTPSPAGVAVDAVIKALTDPRPAARYLAGRDARMLNLLRRLPDRLMRNLGLRDELVEQPRAAVAAPQPASR
jgi:hypothetical protein